MEYFAQRHGYITEYSGYEDVASGLRIRLQKAIDPFTSYGDYFGTVSLFLLDSKIMKLFAGSGASSFSAAMSGEHFHVFTAIELLVEQMAHWSEQKNELINEIVEAFDLSGSVYFFDTKTNEVCLRVDEVSSETVSRAAKLLSEKGEGSEDQLTLAYTNLVRRKMPPYEVIKSSMVSVESFLKAVTGKDNADSAMKLLQQEKVLHSTQFAIYEKLKAFKGDTDNASHSANHTATEKDALWFVVSASAFVLLLKEYKKQS